MLLGDSFYRHSDLYIVYEFKRQRNLYLYMVYMK